MSSNRSATLGISGWRLHGQRTGIGRYILSLVECLTEELVAPFFDGVNLYTPQPLSASPISLPRNVYNRVLSSRLAMLPWENFRLGPSAKDPVMLYPSFSRPLVVRGASVVTTHDATMRIVPRMFTRKDRLFYDRLYGWSARAATVVLTTSEAAKRDIAREWRVDPAKIRVTPLAAAPAFHPLPATVNRERLRYEMFRTDAPYFVFVGKISGRRNVSELLKAFAQYRRLGHPQRLLVVGPDHAVRAVRAIASELAVDRDLVTRSFVTDVELNQFFNCADGFIMPSAYENGSLPVFEAQASGTPVISIDTDGSREITQGSALLIPHLDAPSLLNAMIQLGTDADLRARLCLQGLENSRQYSWHRCAQETLAACAEAAEIHAS